MDILEAYDLVGTYRGAAELAGCDKNTVKHYVQRRDAGLEPDAGVVRTSITDGFRAKIEQWVEPFQRGHPRHVVHDKLVVMGFDGSKRTTRRAGAEAKKHSGRTVDFWNAQRPIGSIGQQWPPIQGARVLPTPEDPSITVPHRTDHRWRRAGPILQPALRPSCLQGGHLLSGKSVLPIRES